jgi:fructose-1-phosphate kinase PfkB-like protein
VTTGLCGGRRGAWLIDALTSEGLHPSFSHVAGETRATYTLLGPHGEVLMVAEPGPEVSWKEFRGFLAHLRGSLLPAASMVVVSGSVPQGFEAALMRDLVGLIRGSGRRVLVDTSRECLRAALDAGADLVKVNLDECVEAGLVDRSANSLEAADALVGAGAGTGIVTNGDKAAAWSGNGQRVVVEAPKVDVVSTVGAGDVFTAALVDSLLSRGDPQEAMRAAAVTAAATCLNARPGHIDMEDVRRLSE